MVRDEQLVRTSSACRVLGLGAVAALLIGAFGCGDHAPKEGGATTSKARENRKIAETAMLESVQIAAKEQVAAHEELRKKGILTRTEEKVKQVLGMNTVTVSASAPPVPPTVPSAPVPPKPAFTPPPFIAPPAIPRQEPMRVNTRPSSLVVISERIVTEIPYASEAEADMRSLEEAQKLIETRLRELDPPVEYRPSISVIKNEYVRRDSRLVRLPSESEANAMNQAGYSERKYVDYTVEVTADQIRELRTRNRLADSLRILAAIAAVSLAGFCFLRLDEWSKGYLTSWLALAAAAIGGGIVVLVFTA